jgi:hypothetical protein
MITHKPNEMPAFWWLNPWAYALNLKQALHAVDLLTETTEDAYQAAKNVIKQKEELADYHRNNLNTFQRKVELALKPACPHLYEDTIGYVHWAADEIKALRASLSVITEDRDAYISKVQELQEEQQGLLHEARVAIANNETNEGNIDNLEARLEGKQSFINQALKDLEACQDRIAELEGKRKPKAKRKPAKKKAKPLWENKTAGVSFALGNHEDRHDPVREAYAALGRKFLKAGIKAQAKAKKGAPRA